MKLLTPIWCGLALMMLGMGCEKPINLDQALVEPRLVVVCSFTPDHFFKVQVSKNRPVLDASAPTEYLGNATVEVFAGEQLLERLVLVPGIDREPPFYTSVRVKPQVGVEYTIRASAPGFPSVQAQNRIPDSVQLEEINVTNFTLIRPVAPNNLAQASYRINLRFTDPPRQENFYHLYFFQQFNDYRLVAGDTLVTGVRTIPLQVSAEINNNFRVANYNGGILLEDRPFDGQQLNLSYPVSLQLVLNQSFLGPIQVELRSVSKEYYLFFSSLSRQQNNANVPFSEPVIVFNNIRHGQGIFAGFSKSRGAVAFGR